MNFVQAVIAGYSKYFDFSSRSCRSEYWWFMLFGVFVSFIFNFLKMQSVIPNFVITKNYNHLILEMIVGWGIIGIPVFSVSVRRLHDIGKSGWFLLKMPLLQILAMTAVILVLSFFGASRSINLIAMIVMLVFLYVYWIALMSTKGDKDDNQYGDNPLKFLNIPVNSAPEIVSSSAPSGFGRRTTPPEFHR